MKESSFHKSILLWFSLAFTILIIVGISGYQSLKQLNEQKEQIGHSFLVINLLNQISLDAKEHQSSLRGYLITGEQKYLASLNDPRLNDNENLTKLSALLMDNEGQSARASHIKELIETRKKIVAQLVSVYSEKGQQAAVDFFKQNTSQSGMDELQILIDSATSEESHLLSERQKSEKVVSSTTLKIGSSGLFICVIILFLVLSTIYRESAKREEIEISLQKALSDMEQVSQQNASLSKLSDYMQSCQSIDEAFNVIDNTLPLLLPDAAGAVSVFKKTRDLVETVSKWGLATIDAPKDFHPDQCWGLRRGRAHYFVPGGTEPCCTHFAAEPIGASLCLPMQAQGETVGLFSLLLDTTEKANKERIAFARRVSEQISLAVANLNLQKKLLEQSIRDPLTKLFNRRYLEATLERELKRAERNKEAISVLVMDIDFFKKFNDTMGHDAGDALLVKFAAMLEQNVRKEDIVCRYGGEEFVVVLPKANLQQGIDRAEKICAATRQIKIAGAEKGITSVSVSIGVSVYPEHGAAGPDLITVADNALYKAKHNGRDQVMPAA